MVFIGVDEFRRIIETLRECDIGFEVTEHEAVETSQEAADVRGAELKTGVKAMVFKAKDQDSFVMALVPADKRVDVAKLEEQVEKSIELANPAYVKRRTGCEVGAVPPFGFTKPLQTFFDPSILENEKVNFNAGLRTRSVHMGAKDLVSVIDATKVNIAED